jgi:hypothetical protein
MSRESGPVPGELIEIEPIRVRRVVIRRRLLQRVAWALLTLSARTGIGPGLGPLLSGHPIGA